MEPLAVVKVCGKVCERFFARVNNLSNFIAAAQDRTRKLSRENLPGYRRFAFLVLENNYIQGVMGCVIVCNLVVLALEADQSAACEGQVCINSGIMAANIVFLLAYTVEFVFRLILTRWIYFLSVWNLVDFVVMLVGWVDLLIIVLPTTSNLPNLNALRICRVLRLARAIRLAHVFPELYSMLIGFKSAMMAMWWGTLMIMILLFIFSVMAVELILPIQLGREMMPRDQYCDEAFSSVFNSVLFFFQTLVAGDSWGECAVPLIKLAPWTCGTLFLAALCSIHMGFTNLILAAIVETAAAARDADIASQAKAKEKSAKETALKLQALLDEMDENGNGLLTVEELLRGYDEISDMSQLLTMLDISRDDLVTIFTFMDANNSGDLDAEEFIKCIQSAQATDFRCQMMLMRLQIQTVVDSVAETAAAVKRLSGAHLNTEKKRCGQNSMFGPRTRRSRAEPEAVDIAAKPLDGFAKMPISQATPPVAVTTLHTTFSELSTVAAAKLEPEVETPAAEVCPPEPDREASVDEPECSQNSERATEPPPLHDEMHNTVAASLLTAVESALEAERYAASMDFRPVHSQLALEDLYAKLDSRGEPVSPAQGVNGEDAWQAQDADGNVAPRFVRDCLGATTDVCARSEFSHHVRFSPSDDGDVVLAARHPRPKSRWARDLPDLSR